MKRAEVIQALKNYDKGNWTVLGYLSQMGCTYKQILKFRQGGKVLKCSPCAYAKLQMYLNHEKQHWPTLLKVIEAKYPNKQ